MFSKSEHLIQDSFVQGKSSYICELGNAVVLLLSAFDFFLLLKQHEIDTLISKYSVMFNHYP